MCDVEAALGEEPVPQAEVLHPLLLEAAGGVHRAGGGHQGTQRRAEEVYTRALLQKKGYSIQKVAT